MERLKERLQITKKALFSLDEALKLQHSKIVRDASIQRFEFCLEALWKLAQRYLLIYDGLEIGSPKGVIRGCFQSKLLEEDQTQILLEAVDDRNLTVHTYNENLVEQIYQHIFIYQPVFNKLFNAIEKKVLLSHQL